MCVYVCVCVRERDRQTDRQTERQSQRVCVHVCVCSQDAHPRDLSHTTTEFNIKLKKDHKLFAVVTSQIPSATGLLTLKKYWADIQTLVNNHSVHELQRNERSYFHCPPSPPIYKLINLLIEMKIKTFKHKNKKHSKKNKKRERERRKKERKKKYSYVVLANTLQSQISCTKKKAVPKPQGNCPPLSRQRSE